MPLGAMGGVLLAGVRKPALTPCIEALQIQYVATFVTLRVRGEEYECPTCHRGTTVPMLIEPVGVFEDTEWCHGLSAQSGVVLQYAADLLKLAGRGDLAGVIKLRFSKSTKQAYVSNGCRYCDTLFGDYFMSTRLIGDVDGLEVLAEVQRPLVELVLLTSSLGRLVA